MAAFGESCRHRGHIGLALDDRCCRKTILSTSLRNFDLKKPVAGATLIRMAGLLDSSVA
jgi:hypothetical protein